MTSAHRRYLVLEQGVGAGVFNTILNAGIAWALFRTLPSVPLWGSQSIAGDTFATCFVLPLLTCLIVTRLAHREVDRGRLPTPSWSRRTHATLGRLPTTTGRRALVFGAVSMLLFAPPTCAVLALLGTTDLGLTQFITFKAIFAGGLAAIVTPIIAWCALGDLT